VTLENGDRGRRSRDDIGDVRGRRNGHGVFLRLDRAQPRVGRRCAVAIAVEISPEQATATGDDAV
jgi:hypothetical protein